MGYRTIEQAYDFLHEKDKQSAITKYYLRMLCKKGEILVLNIGSKFLINMTSLLDYLKLNYEEK